MASLKVRMLGCIVVAFYAFVPRYVTFGESVSFASHFDHFAMYFAEVLRRFFEAELMRDVVD
jgi:hypothetical protein